MDWLSDTINDCGHNEHSDFYGWMREDLFPFLLSHGFDVGPNFPLWAPSSEVSNKGDAAPADISEESDVNHPIEYPNTDDFDHEKWPEKLGVALTAWRAACNADLSETTAKEYMKERLKEWYPSMLPAEIDRIATVANWDNSPGRPKKVNK